MVDNIFYRPNNKTAKRDNNFANINFNMLPTCRPTEMSVLCMY